VVVVGFDVLGMVGVAVPALPVVLPELPKNSVVVTLDPDVAAVFPGAREANDALRTLAGVIRRYQVRRPSRQSA